mmetsp:Transcript_15251/g.26235  ORF Transcript_15251/g.26235 Transcript_15251/m.26235 type:complete len:233 (+) Transcript_15251:29-727(+)
MSQLKAVRRFSSLKTISRCMATKTFESKPVHKPPLELSGAIGTYTTALWSAALENNEKQKVEKDASAFLAASKDEGFQNFLSNPFIPKDERLKAIAPVLKKLSFSSTSENFIRVLVQKNRLVEASEYFSAYLAMCKADEGKIEGVLTTARPLSDDEFKKISSQVDKMTQKELGTNVQLERQVDESIVDGLLLKFGNYELDLTARTFLVKEIDAQLNAILEDVSSMESKLQRI